MNVIGSKLKLLWERIIFSRLTIIYFIFSVVHCSIQVIFQIQAFSINDQAGSFLYSVVIQGNATDPNAFPVLGKNDLRMCDRVPSSFSTSPCRVIWNGTALNDNVVYSSSSVSPPFETVLVASNSTSTIISSSAASTLPPVSTTSSGFLSSTAATPTISKSNIDHAAAATTTVTIFAISTAPSSDDGDNDADTKSKRDHTDFGTIAATNIDDQIQVNIDGLGYNDDNVTLDRACLVALDYPLDMLLNTKREDITFIAFQFWVLGMSTVAILNESIPHIIASLLTHMLATAWAGFQIVHTAGFKTDFSRLVTNGVCKPIDLLPHYWEQRRNAEIPSLALNAAALLTSAFLTWKLVKLFGWQTFKRVGASMTINRVYKLVLILSITIQLSLFFMVVTVALWIDQLWNGRIAHLARLAFVYKPVFIIVLVLLVPWLMTGWFAVRRELQAPMLIFLMLSFGYLAGWGAMFSSTTFRWTFVQWLFFGLIASSSVILTFVALILGLICRLNFGKGLPRYLSAQQPLTDEKIPDPYWSRTRQRDPEKVDFPSHAHPIPTFSAAFGSGDEVPLPIAGRQRGPRFYNAPTELFDQQSGAQVSGGLSAHNRSPPIVSLSPERDKPQTSSGRHSSQWSVSSAGSWSETAVERDNSQSSQSTSVRVDSKRWVIE